MTNTDYPWEPPMAGTEAAQLTGALDRLRTIFRWKADDLDAAGLQIRVGASTLTLGGLLKHLAINEDYMFTTKLTGEPLGAPWDALGWDGSDDERPIRRSSSMRCGTMPSSGPAAGSARPWPTAGWANSSTPPGPTAPTPASAASCAT